MPTPQIRELAHAIDNQVDSLERLLRYEKDLDARERIFNQSMSMAMDSPAIKIKAQDAIDSILNEAEGGQPFPIDLSKTDEVALDFILWFKHINENAYKRDRPFHVSELIASGTEPELYWFRKIFGSIRTTPIDINSRIGYANVRCYVVDRYYMEHYKANYIGDIINYEPGDSTFHILARMDKNTKISLIFYNREVYEKVCRKIFGHY